MRGYLIQEVSGKRGPQIRFLPNLEYCSSIFNLVYFIFFVSRFLVLMLYMGEQILLLSEEHIGSTSVVYLSITIFYFQ